MLTALIKLSLRHRFLVLALAVVCLVGGSFVAREMPVDVLPELNKPIVTVLAECPALSSEDTATQVTRPLEAALLGLPGLDRLRSSSDGGLSVIYAEFAWGTNLREARLLVQERISATASRLPDGVMPNLAPASSLMGEIMLIGLTSADGKVSPPELRTLADTTVRRALLSVPGVADALPMGGGVEQIHVLPDPRKLVAHEISLEEVKAAVSKASGNATAGWLNLNSREMPARTVGLTTDLTELRRVPVKMEEDHVILLGDIARVEAGTQPMRGDVSVNGKPGVILSVDKSPAADTLKLTREIESTLEQLKPALPPGVEFTTIFKQANFIEQAVTNLRHVLRDGAIIVAIVLFVFLLSLRTTLITLLAIPLSFAVTILVFRVMGIGMNAMTLGGLAVAVGMVVDDAIVDVENVFRRWRENRRSATPQPILGLVASASSEVRNSILYATILVVLGFLPIAFLPGLGGQLFWPVALATCVSMAASFLVSLTVIPVLCSLAIQAPGRRALIEDSPMIRGVKWVAERTFLPLALERPFFVLGLAAVAFSGAVAVYPTLRQNFLPVFQESSATVSLVTPPGTSLYASSQLGEVGAALLARIPEIESVGRRTGRAERDDHIVPVSITEYDLELRSNGRPRAVVLEEVRRTLTTIPGTLVAIGTPIGHRLSHMLSGTTAPLSIKVFGVDQSEAKQISDQLVEIARATPGLIDVLPESQGGTTQVTAVVDRERALAYALPVTEFSEQVADMLGGHVVARVPQGERTIEFAVRLAGEWTDTPEELGNLPILAPSGQILPLRGVADIHETTGPGVINRENGQARVLVTANVRDRDWPGLIQRLDERLRENLKLPPGAFYRLEGEFAARQAAFQRILVVSGIVLLVIGALLYGYFRSGTLALQVLLNIPLALLGAVIFSRVVSDQLSVATLVGFVAVGGVAARNGVLMLSHYLHLMKHEGESFTRRMVIRGTLDRLSPVLMTALCAGVALLPLVFAADQPGRELLHPVAVGIVGGLASSTFLDLCVTPAVFYHFGRRAAAKALQRRAAAGN